MTPLRYAREKAGYSSQRQLAIDTGVWPTQISRIEGGRPATRSVAKKLLKRLGDHVTILDLMCPEDFKAPSARRKAVRKQAA